MAVAQHPPAVLVLDAGPHKLVRACVYEILSFAPDAFEEKTGQIPLESKSIYPHRPGLPRAAFHTRFIQDVRPVRHVGSCTCRRMRLIELYVLPYRDVSLVESHLLLQETDKDSRSALPASSRAFPPFDGYASDQMRREKNL